MKSAVFAWQFKNKTTPVSEKEVYRPVRVATEAQVFPV
jgi:hypothetical protein